ncbi:Uncharacterized protein HZ326_11694 [Fusarium oxysporum f. sp. albedinis]|nr:Uncharacterized protein HZ326_11694 [Fusarium oxysporum f. sp. albedinis]
MWGDLLMLRRRTNQQWSEVLKSSRMGPGQWSHVMRSISHCSVVHAGVTLLGFEQCYYLGCYLLLIKQIGSFIRDKKKKDDTLSRTRSFGDQRIRSTCD